MTSSNTRRSSPPAGEGLIRYERLEQILRSRNRVLRQLTSNAPLEGVFTSLCEGIEEVMPGVLCSVLVLDRKSGTLHYGAAPSLPASYVAETEGFRIGPGRGSCGHAAATGEVTMVEDVETHPYWAPFRDVARRAGFRACWSQPIRDMGGAVAGTLAMYHREPCLPEAWERELFETSAAVAGFAIDHWRGEDRRRELHQQLRQIIDLVPLMIFAKDRRGRFLLANAEVARAYGTTVEDLIGRPHADVHTDPSELEHMLADDREVIDSGRSKVIPEETFVDADGRQRVLQTTKIPYEVAGGRETAVLGVAVDITERKRREEQRREALLRSQRGQAAIVQLATHRAVLSGDIARAARRIDEVVAETIGVERVSVWLLERERTELRCIDLFEKTPRRHSKGTVFLAEQYPKYFEALKSSRAIDAHDALDDPRTAEFVSSYLAPLGIRSMLDAPIRVAGEVVGVVCHEHVAEPRRWTADELAFGAEVADQAAQALIQRERKRNEAALRRGERLYRKLNEELERRVADRTEELARVNAELRRLTSDLLLAEERERRSLAVDLHDGPNQLLVLAQMKLAALRQASSAGMRAAVEEVEDLVERANTSSRTLTFQLSPPVLHDLGLAAAAQWLVEDLQRAYGIAITLEEDGRVRDTGERTRVILFRALRELLVNVGKHARASRARVRLRRDGQRVRITVEDDGRGFDAERVPHGGFGLPSIRERLRHLGGEMHVHSKLGKGTRVELSAPLDPEMRDGEEEQG